jgi:hypothetical protein
MSMYFSCTNLVFKCSAYPLPYHKMPNARQMEGGVCIRNQTKDEGNRYNAIRDFDYF